MKKKNLAKEIEKLRKKLVTRNKPDSEDRDLLNISQKLDKLIVKFMKKEYEFEETSG
ncbi:MAG: aspartyl-phosphate phosphatase Spo0E family protein [Halanaerobiaceae bacterium]